MADLNKIIDELSKLTVVEAAELSKQLEEKWGVTAAAPAAAAAGAAAAANRVVIPVTDPLPFITIGIIYTIVQVSPAPTVTVTELFIVTGPKVPAL